ncbi:hypothetical protein BT69DRAFT_1219226 [Atractiella rhizophila]|nr:hypothetical protein BT69DRAFT_1219226 [Atractiella rhizophila]
MIVHPALHKEKDAANLVIQQETTGLLNLDEEEEDKVELIPLLVSGPPGNRFDFVYFADGYTKDDKDKFIADARNLTLEIAVNQTFAAVAPLSNFWAAFIASNERGIGVDGKPKDTWAGLYRPGTELRGVMYAHPERPRKACALLGDACDQPILLGNDPLYGGLGGEFTTITASPFNGKLILRHELGHSVIPVGEEYDGGWAYFGVNAHHNTSITTPWKHWYTAESTDRVERSNMPLQDYAWTILNTTKAWSTRFYSTGTFDSSLLRFSISAFPVRDWVSVRLDGKEVDFEVVPDIGKDRWWYEIEGEALQEGWHDIVYELKNGEWEGETQMCSVEMLEYGNEDEFVKTPGHYGLYPTYSFYNETSYRPTNEDCLMRQVTSTDFCTVCKEGLWLSILSRVSLIDDISYDCESDIISLTLVSFPKEQDVTYSVTWYFDGEQIEEWDDLQEVNVDEHTVEIVKVKVELKTPEIRKDEKGYSVDEAEVVITEC